MKQTIIIILLLHTWTLAKWIYGKQAWGSYVYEFYVPEGTVISNYYDVGVE